MRKYLILLCLFAVSCSSVQKLSESSTCNVWEDQKFLGPNAIEVKGTEAEWKGKCAFVFWLCEWVRSDMPEGEQSVYLDGNGIFTTRKVVAKLSNDVMTYESTFLDKLAKSSPVIIDHKSLRATRNISSEVMNMEDHQELSFNRACNSKQVALGAVTLWAMKNRH